MTAARSASNPGYRNARVESVISHGNSSDSQIVLTLIADQVCPNHMRGLISLLGHSSMVLREELHHQQISTNN